MSDAGSEVIFHKLKKFFNEIIIGRSEVTEDQIHMKMKDTYAAINIK